MCQEYYEVVEDCHIVKAGRDGLKVAVVDLTWASPDSARPAVSVVLRDAADYEPDAAVAETVRKNKLLLLELVRRTG